MKNWLGIGMLLVLSVFIWAHGSGQDQKKSDPDVNEIVEVINVEMIARVQKQGQPVGGLQKEDFILTENGREVEINGFREVRRRISAPPAIEEKAAPTVQNPPGRLFVLCFWLWDRGAAYTEALDHFFRDIYRPGDDVILAHTANSVLINAADQIAPLRAQFEAELKKGIEQDNIMRIQIYKDIDAAIADFLVCNEGWGVCKVNLQTEITRCWNEFRLNFLRGDAGSLIRLADSIKSINLEKWVLVFLQEEVFPEFGLNGSIPAFRDKFEEIRKNLGDGSSALNDKVRSSFIAADATFSLIRLKSSSLEDQGSSPYYRQKAVYSNRDECFRQISRVTGGTTITDNNLTRALNQAADLEGISYVITFAPKDIKKKRKMKLTCRDTSLKVFASQHIDTRDPREMAIAKVKVVDSKLTFNLSGFSRLFEAGQLQGRVQ
ncbi:MAG: hypothetical protein IH584_01475, partial [Candidatus Aminicenantes bacterium]|nr:hypothetical protein [Candidatus Aminicenantes bacterium]